MSENLIHDKDTKIEILEELKNCTSFFVWHNLPTVAVELTHRFPIDQVSVWFLGNETMVNAEKLKITFDDRLTSLAFLRRLVNSDLYDAPSRLSDGHRKLDLDKIVARLTQLSSFEFAINTWILVCREWLSICNIDYIVTVIEKMGPRPNDISFAKLLVTVQELTFE